MRQAMPHAIHWDYADSFTGRDAAYLIAGLDPSSSSTEDAFRVQGIVQKLKDAYYLACSEIKHDLHLDHKRLGGLHKHRYKKNELLSVKLERMIENFMSSAFVFEGHLEALEGFDRSSENFDEKHEYQDGEELKSVNIEFKSAREQLSQHWEKLSPHDYAQLMEIEKNLSDVFWKLSNQDITFNEYGKLREELSFKSETLHAELNKKSFADNPSILTHFNESQAKWENLHDQRSGWADAKSREERDIYNKCRHLHIAATQESFEWDSVFIHEFGDQKFSRTELCRWLSENNYPTAYAFASNRPTEETPLSSKERTNYLHIIGALADLYWKTAHPDEKYVQATLVADLEKYKDFRGMAERNLKEKLSMAKKAIES